MAAIGTEHEALRYFRALSPDEKLENLWMGMRELNDLGQGMIQRQDHTNGTVQQTAVQLGDHLEAHKIEDAEMDFIKRWGGRGTGLLALLIALSTAILAVDGKFVHLLQNLSLPGVM